MRKNTIFCFVLLIVCGMLLFSACHMPTGGTDGLSDEEKVQTAIVQTQAAMGQEGEAAEGEGENENNPAVAGVPSPTSNVTLTLTPTLKLSPTMTLTPTLSVPMVSVSVDTNCRTGPGKIYDYIGALIVGETAEVVGQSMDGQYWIIKNPDQPGECWLWGYYATVEGPVAGLPKYTPPPTPTPSFFWAGDWTFYIGDPIGILFAVGSQVTVNGKQLTGSYTLGGEVNTFSGTISDDYLSVTGTWDNPNFFGDFEWFAMGSNQFSGNGYGVASFAWCGSRGGAGQPVPCYAP